MRPFLITVLLGYLGTLLIPGCSRYAGTFIRSHEEATAMVGTYRAGFLTEPQFLEDWPLLENQPGNKHRWEWGILRTSSRRVDYKVTRSYWLGYFESKISTSKRQSGGYITVRDSSGTHIVEPTYHTNVEEHWIVRDVWRLDFQDSVLVSVADVHTP